MRSENTAKNCPKCCKIPKISFLHEIDAVEKDAEEQTEKCCACKMIKMEVFCHYCMTENTDSDEMWHVG